MISFGATEAGTIFKDFGGGPKARTIFKDSHTCFVERAKAGA